MKKVFMILIFFFIIVTSCSNPSESGGVRVGAICKDGTSSTATGSGACSSHGGVDHWIYK